MIHWLIHLDTQKEHKVSDLLSQIQKAINRPLTEIKPEIYYKDDRWRVKFTTPNLSSSWDSQIANTLRLAQNLSYSWNLLGDCDGTLEGIANEKFRLSGILWIHWEITKAE